MPPLRRLLLLDATDQQAVVQRAYLHGFRSPPGRALLRPLVRVEPDGEPDAASAVAITCGQRGDRAAAHHERGRDAPMPTTPAARTALQKRPPGEDGPAERARARRARCRSTQRSEALRCDHSHGCAPVEDATTAGGRDRGRLRRRQAGAVTVAAALQAGRVVALALARSRARRRPSGSAASSRRRLRPSRHSAMLRALQGGVDLDRSPAGPSSERSQLSQPSVQAIRLRWRSASLDRARLRPRQQRVVASARAVLAVVDRALARAGGHLRTLGVAEAEASQGPMPSAQSAIRRCSRGGRHVARLGRSSAGSASQAPMPSLQFETLRSCSATASAVVSSRVSRERSQVASPLRQSAMFRA